MIDEIHVCKGCHEEFSEIDYGSHTCVAELQNARVFDFDFIQEMRNYLLAKTENDACITRTQLCTDLKLDSKMDTVIGAIVKLIMPGFKIWMGPGGGIGRIDRKSSKKDREPGAYAPKLSDEDAAKILATLEKVCGGGLIVPRKKIPTPIGTGSTKAQNLISAALKRPEFDDFATKNGKGGGVYKISKRPDLVKRVARAAKTAVPAPAALPKPSVASAPAPTPVPEEDLSAPLDTALEEQTEQKLSPLERRWASNQATEQSTDAS